MKKLVLLIVLLVGGMSASAATSSYRDFWADLRDSGQEDIWPKIIAEAVGFSGDQRTRLKYFESASTLDGVERVSRLVLEDGAAKAVVLWTWRESARTKKTLGSIYRVSLDGKLERAVECNGLIDDKGEPVEGSRNDVPLDVTSSRVKKGFRRELDFWLKGIGQRKNRTSPAPVAGTPAQPAKAGPVANSR